MVCAVLGLYALILCWRNCPEIRTRSIEWAKLSRFYLKIDIDSLYFKIKKPRFR
jgi:hypothetical protein